MTSSPTFAVIGLGRMGARVIAAGERARMRLVAVHDVMDAPFALDQRPELAEVRRATVEDVLAAAPDVLAIATTAPSHAPLLDAALDAGLKRFMVEKPFVTGIDEGRTVLDKAERLGARVVVNHGRRFHPAYAALKARDGTPELGDLRAIGVTMGAGGLGCMGVHYLDLFAQMFDAPPARVYAVRSGRVEANPRGADFDDPGAQALLSWPDGRRASLDACDDTGIPPWLEFRFTYGRVVIENEMTPWRMFHRSDEDRALPLTRYGQPNAEFEMPGFAKFDILDMCEAALMEAAGDGPQQAGGEAALDAVACFAAIRASVETGGPVDLPVTDPALRGRRFPIP